MLHNQNGAGTNKFNLYTVINNTPDTIWCIDATYTLIAANKAFFQLHSTSHREKIDIGDSVFLHSSKEACEKWLALYNRALAGEVVFIEETKEIDNREYYYDMSITPVYDDNDKQLIACVVVAKDVSSRKIAEQAVSAYGRRFKTFTHKTTHELRNPLANILALIELGKNENISFEELKEIFSLIDDSAQQLDGIVKELIVLMSKSSR
jgi:PAS domain S-box-containing protein